MLGGGGGGAGAAFGACSMSAVVGADAGSIPAVAVQTPVMRGLLPSSLSLARLWSRCHTLC